jgi:cell division protein FtsI/penicillin-binding protein 2
VVAIEPGTGKIKAAAVNRHYSLNQRDNGPHTDRRKHRADVPSNYPNTVVPLLGGGDMPGSQAGSTFKIFTLVAALDLGLPSRSFASRSRGRSRRPVQ